jgi:predicted lipid-binding transport protein (Tim44 family)
MKQLMMLVLALFVTTGLGITDAEAKRLGGGKSLGMQRDNVMQRNATPTAPTAPAQAAPARPGAAPGSAPQPSGMSRWLGPIAGLAAGLGLAALASHLGLGEEFATFLMLALLAAGAVFLFRMLRRPKAQPAGLQYAGSGLGGAASTTPRPMMPASPAPSGAPASIPAGFDVEGFLRNAKVNFLRLQAANDAGNIEDIREFATPEMFAELRLDLQDRGGAGQQTDVVTLEAALLDVSEEAGRYLASVRFHGSIRETEGAQPEAFDEVWHLAKPVKGGGGWVIAGIQQTA